MRAAWSRLSQIQILEQAIITPIAKTNATPKASPKALSSANWTCTQCRSYGQQLSQPQPWSGLHPRDGKLWGSRKSTSVRQESTSSKTNPPPQPQQEQHAIADSTTREDLPSKEENRRSPLSKRFSHLMDNLQSNVFLAGQRLNDLTGYSGIEALKRDIEAQGASVPFLPQSNPRPLLFPPF